MAVNNLKKKFVGDNQIDGDKILLESGQSIKAKSSLGVEQDLIKVGPAGEVLVGASNDEVSLKSESVQKAGDTMEGNLTIDDGSGSTNIVSPEGSSIAGGDATSEYARLGYFLNLTPTATYQKFADGGMGYLTLGESDSSTGASKTIDIQLTGISMTQSPDGSAPVPLEPTLPEHVVVKKYVDDEIAAESSSLQGNINAVSDDVSHLVTLSGVAVDSDNLGTFTGTTIADAQNIKQALQALESAVEAVSGGGSSTQDELDDTQLGAGLEIDGSYLAPAVSNYLASASSLKDADSKLDTQIKTNSDDIADLVDEDLLFLKLDGTRPMEANLNMMNGLVHNKIVGLADPTDARDAVNKQYVDAIAEGLHVHAPAKALVFSPISGSVTYDNGSSGQGATLTLGTAITSVDDYSLQNGDRIIITGQANQAHNGIYTWATGGTVLTRAEDFNSIVEAAGGDFVFVQEGTQYGNTGWVMTETTSAIGTSPIIFLQFSGAGSYIAGDALSLTGSEFNVLYDGSTIGVNGSNQLYIPLLGVGTSQLANDSVTADKIADSAVTSAQIDSSVAGDAMEKDLMSGKLDVRVDGTRIGINGSNQLYIPLLGVGTSELANDSVTADKIADSAVTSAQIDSSVAGDAMEKDLMSGKLDVRVDGTRIGINGSNQLYIPLLGVGTSELANDSVTADKIADSAVTSAQIDSSVAGDALEKDLMSGKLDVRVDGTRIGINGSNQLYIPLLGVGTSELANDSVTADKIAANAVTQEQVDSSVAGNGIEKDLISGKLNVKLDGSSLAVSVSGIKSNIVWDDAFFNLTATDITNGYVDLAFLAEPKSIIGFVDRLAMFEGQDFIVSTSGGVSRITFSGDMIPPGSSVLDDSDNLYFKFQKKEA